MKLAKYIAIAMGGLITASAWAQAPAPGALPAGHPDIGSMRPATQPSSTGSLAIRVMQGTKGGPAITEDPVVVELYHQQKVIRKLEGKLDKVGVYIAPDLPMLLPFQPVAHVVHSGVDYQVIGPVMDSTHPNQKLDLTVYETTEQAPAWQVQMRHVMTKPAPEGVEVTEVLVVSNPTDRSWIGAAQAGGQRATFTIPLPPGAQKFQADDELQDACTVTPQGTVIASLPIPPGESQFKYAYVMPTKDGQAQLTIKAPAPVQKMVVFASGDGQGAKVQGLQPAGVHDMGEGKAQMFQGADLKVGQEVVLSLAGAAAAPATAADAVPAAASLLPKVIAGVGGALILVIGAGVILLKPRKA